MCTLDDDVVLTPHGDRSPSPVERHRGRDAARIDALLSDPLGRADPSYNSPLGTQPLPTGDLDPDRRIPLPGQLFYQTFGRNALKHHAPSS